MVIHHIKNPDQEGDVKNIYTGHPDVNHENKLFSPTGIVSTPSDKFVVADQNHHIIHILSSDGQFDTLLPKGIYHMYLDLFHAVFIITTPNV
jgi:hypothetical protein